MEFPLISVIVPVYNVEQYLLKCLKSLQNQTYKNIQILMVNDGSTDNSQVICELFANTDKRFELYNKDNGGVSSARNLGLLNSRGDYIVFVDADDWLPIDCISILSSNVIETGADYCVGHTTEVSLKKYKKFFKGNCDVVERNNINKFFDFVFCIPSVVWASIFKNTIIKNNKLLFDTEMKYGEDACFLYNYFKYCDILVSVDSNVYYYNRLVVNSASKKYYNQFGDWCCRSCDAFYNIFNSDEMKKIEHQKITSRIGIHYESMSDYYLYHYCVCAQSKEEVSLLLSKYKGIMQNYSDELCMTYGIKKITLPDNSIYLQKKSIFSKMLTKMSNMIKNTMRRFVLLYIYQFPKKHRNVNNRQNGEQTK